VNRGLFQYVGSLRRGLILVVALGLVAAGATVAQSALLSKIIGGVFAHRAGLGQVTGLLIAW
jgi:hypothetical protein